jgi:hypothetical protein
MMEFVVMNFQHTEGKEISGWESLLWTERYGKCGDFKMVTGLVEQHFNEMPLGATVYLRDSSVPMIIETKKIVRKRGQPDKLEIEGRSYESILDRRVFCWPSGARSWKVWKRTPSEVASLAIESSQTLFSYNQFDPTLCRTIPIPDWDGDGYPFQDWSIEFGDVLSLAEKILAIRTDQFEPRSLRAVRPNWIYSTVVDIEIYQGTDRSASVFIDAARNAFDDGTYLYSIRDWKNVGMYASPSLWTTDYNPLYPGQVLTGNERRVHLELGDVTTTAEMHRELDKAMSQRTVKTMFDGQINQDYIPYVYGAQYFLGDYVTIRGDYGISNKVQVMEYIRSQDASGYKAYPTLVSAET